MNLYDLLTNYNLSAAERQFDTLYMYPSTIVEPYMCFGTTLTLTANLTASVSINKYDSSVQFFNMWGNELVQVIFAYGSENSVSLFNAERIMDDDCLRIYDTIEDIPEYEYSDNSITPENIEVLKNLSVQIIETLKKDETLLKSVL